MPVWSQLLVVLIGGVHAAASYYYFSRRRHGAVWAAAWVALTLATALLGSPHLLAVFVVIVVVWNAWWASLRPRSDRPWAPDVARQTTGEFVGDRLVLSDVRCFDWRSETEYTQRWERRTYDVSRLDSLELFASYWTGPSIAHLIVSFGFEGQDQLAFSIEVRREGDDVWSNFAGFFKAYELVTIAADERDIIRLRTTIRREDVYLYRLRTTPEFRRRLLHAYVEECNRLARTPRFYHTIATNCTTQIVRLVRAAGHRLPLVWGMIASGHAPRYLHQLGLVDDRLPFRELRARSAISAKGRAAEGDPAFSRRIREGLPEVEPWRG